MGESAGAGSEEVTGGGQGRPSHPGAEVLDGPRGGHETARTTADARGGEAAWRAPRSPTTETARGSEGLGRGQWRLCKARPAGLHPEPSGKQTAASGSPEHSAHRALVSCADGALRLASLVPTYSTIQREMRSSVRHCATPMMKGKEEGTGRGSEREHLFPGHQDKDDAASKQSPLPATKTLDTACSRGGPQRWEHEIWPRLAPEGLPTSARGAGGPTSAAWPTSAGQMQL